MPPVPARQVQADTLKSLLAKPATIERIAAIAPKHLSPERVVKIMLLTFNRDSKLWRCTPQSLLAALMRVAEFGLEPDGRLVHLIPYKDQVNVIIDWKGLVEIARRNGIESNATLVYEEDDFELLPDDGSGKCFLRHTVNPRKPRTKILGAYSRSRRLDGTGQIDYEFMTLSEIEAVRKRSAAANDGPWVTDFGEMARKTVLRRHSKRWPLCAEDRAALDEDDDRAVDIRSTRNLTTTSRPVFDDDDEDDRPQIKDGSSDDREQEDKEKEEAAKSKAKSEKPTKPKSEPAKEVRKEPEPEVYLRLEAMVAEEWGANFAILKGAIVDLGHLPDAIQWKSYQDIPEQTVIAILNKPRGYANAVMVKKEELEKSGGSQ